MNAQRKQEEAADFEARMVGLVRNALLVAGHEMGDEGDHWPVIKSTIKEIDKDYEDLQIERSVHAEMKKHLYKQLEKMEAELEHLPTETKTEAAPKLIELREIYDAFFSEADETKLIANTDEEPMHIKRARAIIATLEADDE